MTSNLFPKHMHHRGPSMRRNKIILHKGNRDIHASSSLASHTPTPYISIRPGLINNILCIRGILSHSGSSCTAQNFNGPYRRGVIHVVRLKYCLYLPVGKSTADVLLLVCFFLPVLAAVTSGGEVTRSSYDLFFLDFR